MGLFFIKPDKRRSLQKAIIFFYKNGLTVYKNEDLTSNVCNQNYHNPNPCFAKSRNFTGVVHSHVIIDSLINNTGL